jgi:hypothetical protein
MFSAETTAADHHPMASTFCAGFSRQECSSKRRKHDTPGAESKGMVMIDLNPKFVMECCRNEYLAEDDTVSSMSCCEQGGSLGFLLSSFSTTTTATAANTKTVQEELLVANGIGKNSTTISLSNISPNTYLAMTLKNRKLKERISPFSLELAMFFEPYQEGDIEFELLRALRSNDLEILKNAAASHELEDVRNRFGENPAHLVCRMGMPTHILQYLVEEKKVPLNVRDRFGRSPLHNACMVTVPNFDNVEFLLEQSPQLFLFEDDSGNTPLECVPRRSFDRWIRFLSERNILKRITSKLEQDKSLVLI